MLLTVREYAEKYGIPKYTINTAIHKGLIVPKKKEKIGFFWKISHTKKEQNNMGCRMTLPMQCGAE